MMNKIIDKKLFDKTDARGLKYYLGFCAIVLSIYIYSMLTGWRYMSYGETSHSKSKSTNRITRIYHHK